MSKTISVQMAGNIIDERYNGYTFTYWVDNKAYHSHGHAMRAAIALLKREVVAAKLRRN